jgi:hypothetical protein
MSLEEFSTWVTGVDGAGPADLPDDRSLGDIGLALVGDAGEVAECLRRIARDGERERLAGELGDVWCYWTRLCVASGVSPADLLARSRAKIEGRMRAAGRTKGTRLVDSTDPRPGG